MIEQQNIRQYQAQRELANCGFTPESIQAIQSTTVITRNGSQHVVPLSQRHLDESSQTANVTIEADSSETIINSLQQQLLDGQRMFSRFKQNADNRIMQLEINLSKAIEQIKSLNETVSTLKSNARASELVDHYANRSDAKPSEKPIDRNRVAPADVQVENIFYSGSRR